MQKSEAIFNIDGIFNVKINDQKKSEKNISLIKNDLIKVLSIESQAINNLINNFPDIAITLVEKVLKTKGRVIFSGMGKSGLIAKKLAATFSSTGTPSFFLHPAEALHGDLGMVKSEDLFIAISKSGTGLELSQIIPLLKSYGNYTCLLCCSNGTLSEQVNLTVQLPFTKEACQMNLAPTTSSTLCMAFGDAIGVVTSKLKQFNKTDFAKFHPAGALGKKLFLKVNSLMVKKNELPFLHENTNFADLLYLISNKRMGVGIVVDSNENLLGIITDGDLRRATQLGPKIFGKKAKDIMTQNPKTINQDILAFDALNIMEKFNITSLLIKNKSDQIIGLIHIHDLLKAGISNK